MLDSGAYSAFRKKVTIDIDDYVQFVKDHSARFETCVNLDVIGDGEASYNNWKYLCSKGIDVMPVYHIGTDEKWLVKYLQDTDYIGLGAVAKLHTAVRMDGLTYIWNKYLRDSNGRPKYKVHGMGLTAVDIMLRYPWYSVDSVSPIVQSAYGGIYLPNVASRRRDFMDLLCYKVSSKSTFHQTGVKMSYFNLPKLVRERHEHFFELKGYTLGDLVYNEHNGKDTPLLSDVAFVETKEISKGTLVDSHLARASWNLMIWLELAKRASVFNAYDILVYVGVGATAQYFKLVQEIGLGALFSYYLVNTDKVLDTLTGQNKKK